MKYKKDRYRYRSKIDNLYLSTVQNSSALKMPNTNIKIFK